VPVGSESPPPAAPVAPLTRPVRLSSLGALDLQQTCVVPRSAVPIFAVISGDRAQHNTDPVFERYNIVSECDLVEAAKKLNTPDPLPSGRCKVPVLRGVWASMVSNLSRVLRSLHATCESVGANTQAKWRGRSADALVQGQELEAWDYRSGEQRGSQVNRIQGPNRLAWKRLPRALDNFRTDPPHMPVRRRCRQMRPPSQPADDVLETLGASDQLRYGHSAGRSPPRRSEQRSTNRSPRAHPPHGSLLARRRGSRDALKTNPVDIFAYSLSRSPSSTADDRQPAAPTASGLTVDYGWMTARRRSSSNASKSWSR
jgi:hypothetical protein